MGAYVRAAVLEEPRTLRVRDVPMPKVSHDDALLRVDACGLCGTDHEYWSGHMSTRLPMIPGHETVGTIARIGDEARDRWGVDVGDRVAVEVFQSCRSCPACLAGDIRACRSHGLADPYGVISFGRAPSLWGGYAEYQYLSADTLLQRVPPELDPVLASTFNAVGGGYRWMRDGGQVRPGQVVVVMGPGLRGLAALVAAKEAGARFVMVIGAGPRDRERLALARRFGADVTVDARADSPAAVLQDATGGLADVVLDVTARAPEALMSGIELTADRGRFVLAGTRGDVDVAGFRPDRVLQKEIVIKGMMGVNSKDFRAAIDLLASGRYPFAEVPITTVGLDGLNDLLATMAGEAGTVPPIFAAVTPRT